MPDSITKILRERGLERQEVTLRLRYDAKMVKHFCLFCDIRTPLFATQGRVFGLMYGHHIDPTGYVIPIGIPCSRCGTVYFVASMSE